MPVEGARLLAAAGVGEADGREEKRAGGSLQQANHPDAVTDRFLVGPGKGRVTNCSCPSKGKWES